MDKTQHIHQALAACLFEMGGVGADNSVQLFPAGTFDAPEGALMGSGPWFLNAAIADKLMAATRGKSDILIDYDHQSLLFTKNLEPLETAGTFSGASLEWREGKGLFATNVQWTAASKAHFKADKYKYISPLFTYAADSGEVTRLISVAITDNPAIKNMQEIELAAASFLITHSHQENTPMNKELLALLGLKEDADEAAVMAACAALKESSDKATELTTQVKTLKEEKQALAATSDTVDESKFVPIAVMTELQAELAALSTSIEGDKVTQLINDNKLKLPTPGLKNWAASQSLAALSNYLETAPEIAALSGMQSDGNSLDDPASDNDANSMVAAANKYQAEQAAIGNDIDDIAALTHVNSQGAKNV